MSYRYRGLVREIRTLDSPLRRYFDDRFPHRAPVQQAYRASAGTQLVGAVVADGGALGGAFDYLMRYSSQREYVPEYALAWFARSPRRCEAIMQIARYAGLAARRPVLTADLDVAIRACFALSRCTDFYRNEQAAILSSPLTELMRTDNFTAEALLGVADAQEIAVARSLYNLALVELAEVLSPAEDTQVAVGARFSLSRLCPADCDIIVDGTLVELKTGVGSKPRRSGERGDSLPLESIYQLVGYALFDTDDRYGIHTVALYSARFGRLHRWPLAELLNTLAGEYVDVVSERARLADMLKSTSQPHISAHEYVAVTDPALSVAPERDGGALGRVGAAAGRFASRWITRSFGTSR